MEFKETHFPGLWLITPRRIGDARGYFCETFRRDLFEQCIGRVDFVQENESQSQFAVARGLHYQAGDAAQAKLVRVTEGAVVDYALDLRKGSPTFGKMFAAELSADNGVQLFMPRGFAHGFVVISPMAKFQYKVDNFYCPAAERCILFSDTARAVRFPIPTGELLRSEKDVRGMSFAAFQTLSEQPGENFVFTEIKNRFLL